MSIGLTKKVEKMSDDLSSVPAHMRGVTLMNADKPLAKYEKTEVARDVLTRYLDGEMIADIAQSYGLKCPDRIYQVLAETAEEQWKQAQAARALSDYDKAEEELKTAADSVSVSRAREVIRSQQWKLERTLRRIYGQEAPQLGGSGVININIGVSRSNPLNDATTVDAQVIDNKDNAE